MRHNAFVCDYWLSFQLLLFKKSEFLVNLVLVGRAFCVGFHFNDELSCHAGYLAVVAAESKEDDSVTLCLCIGKARRILPLPCIGIHAPDFATFIFVHQICELVCREFARCLDFKEIAEFVVFRLLAEKFCLESAYGHGYLVVRTDGLAGIPAAVCFCVGGVFQVASQGVFLLDGEVVVCFESSHQHTGLRICPLTVCACKLFVICRYQLAGEMRDDAFRSEYGDAFSRFI